MDWHLIHKQKYDILQRLKILKYTFLLLFLTDPHLQTEAKQNGSSQHGSTPWKKWTGRSNFEKNAIEFKQVEDSVNSETESCLWANKWEKNIAKHAG